MTESGREDIILMALFMVTKDDALTCANELGIPEEQVTDDVIELVKEKVSQCLGDWREVIKGIVKETVKREAVNCPLGLVCSPCLCLAGSWRMHITKFRPDIKSASFTGLAL